MFFRTISNIFKLKRRIRQEMERRWYERENYRELQSERLKTLVKHAYENVDLYRKKYDEVGVKPEDIKSVDDIYKLPIVTRDDFRRNFPHGLLAQNVNPKDCQVVGTSGSTGVPVRIYEDRQLMSLILLRALGVPEELEAEWGRKVKRRVTIIFETGTDSMENMLFQNVLTLPRFMRRFLQPVDAFADPREHLRALQKHQPGILITYPSVLRNMVIVSREEQIPVPQPTILVTCAEVMDKNTRKLISEAFKGDLLDFYMATEAGIIAEECLNHEGLHIQCSDVVLELLRDGKPAPPGVPGEVIVTGLRNMSTPIIRYSGLGDIAELSDRECSCGNKFPLLKSVEGRIVDSLVLPNGQIIHPFSVTLALRHVPLIAKFQVVQEEMDKVRILIVAEGAAQTPSPFAEGGELWGIIRENFGKLLGEEVKITIDQVEDILPPPGSHHYAIVRSLVEKKSL